MKHTYRMNVYRENLLSSKVIEEEVEVFISKINGIFYVWNSLEWSSMEEIEDEDQAWTFYDNYSL